MKNLKLVVCLTLAISLFISSAFAQQIPVPVQAGNEKKSQPNAGGSEPKMMVQQIKPIISTDLNVKKITEPVSSKPVTTEQRVSKVIVAPVTFTSRPPGMNIVLPKEDVKPVLPSTIIKTVETKPVIAPVKNNNDQNTGPKVAHSEMF